MIVDEYKTKFADLFMEMEKEHGRCRSVEMYHGQEIKDFNGEPVRANIVVKIDF